MVNCGTILLFSSLALNLLPSDALHNGLDLVPPMGWSNWEHWGCNINERLFQQSADALVAKGLAAAGYNLVGVDDCWAQLDRNSTGHLVANPDLFPSGMKALSDYLHARGLKLRMYSSAGTRTCQANMSGSLGYEWIDAQTFAEWGADALKYDDCWSGKYMDVLHDSSRRFPFEPPALLKFPIMGMALNKTGRNISFMCNFPWEEWTRDWPAKGGRWVPEVCNSWRTSSDAQAGFDTSFQVVHHADSFANEVPSGPGAWNHMDALQIGNNRSFFSKHQLGTSGSFASTGMTESEEHMIFSLFALSKTPLMIGADVITLSGHSLATYLNTEVIAVNQDPLGARGRQVQPSSPLPAGGELWSVALSDGGRFAILVNAQAGGSKSLNLTMGWSDLGLQADAGYHVRDVWRHEDLGVFHKSFSASVAPRSCIAIRLQADTSSSLAPRNVGFMLPAVSEGPSHPLQLQGEVKDDVTFAI